MVLRLRGGPPPPDPLAEMRAKGMARKKLREGKKMKESKESETKGILGKELDLNSVRAQ